MVHKHGLWLAISLRRLSRHWLLLVSRRCLLLSIRWLLLAISDRLRRVRSQKHAARGTTQQRTMWRNAEKRFRL